MVSEQAPLRVALYARVSTADRGQDVEVQLVPMRKRAMAEGWQVIEYVDHASASDFNGRKAWRQLMEDADAGRIDVVCCWALDRAFRSVSHCSTTTEHWDARGVRFFVLTQEAINTLTPVGTLVLGILSVVAQFERQLLIQRVKEGMANARRRGSRIGRPSVTERPGFGAEWKTVKAQLDAGTISKRAAARRLGIAPGTLRTLLEATPRRRGPRKRAERTGAAA